MRVNFIEISAFISEISTNAQKNLMHELYICNSKKRVPTDKIQKLKVHK